jgi:signal transduction histidine kinase
MAVETRAGLSRTIGPAESLRVRQHRFTPETEMRFQSTYYADVLPGLRVWSVVLILLPNFLSYVGGTSPIVTRRLYFVAIALGAAIIFAATYAQWFERVWQPFIALITMIAFSVALYSYAAYEARMAAATGTSVNDATSNLLFSVKLYVLLTCIALFRLQFVWSAVLYFGVLGVAVAIVASRLQSAGSGVLAFSQTSLLIVFTLLMLAVIQERYARTAFLATDLLDRERNDERRKRVETEKMLRILGTAIGGIVHDLGSPLTVVQSGAQTLDTMIVGEIPFKDEILEVTAMIRDGATMLNYLRSSLMEETRVLEGKPVPLDRKPASLRKVLAMAVRVQKPQATQGRTICIPDEDRIIDIDAAKMTTVFMNLISNALKYSDDEIRADVSGNADVTLIAIVDRGLRGRGINRQQAAQLFVPFGRLDAHQHVEGTGLGLLSARAIAEAHGGELYIESRDGNSGERFTTGGYNTGMLPDGFATAFVVALPSAGLQAAADQSTGVSAARES